MQWTFYLNVTNDTDRDLLVTESQLQWGYWNTGGEENKLPIAIKAGETVQAVGVKSAFGPNGYEFSCAWTDDNQAKEPYGVVSIEVDVPYTGKNKSYCQTNGLFEVTGWNELPEDGHNFVRNMTISSRNSIKPQPKTEDDLITDWSRIREVKEVREMKEVDFNQLVPKILNFETMYKVRTPYYEIPKDLWAGIYDPAFPNAYSKVKSIEKYFSVAVISVNAIPSEKITITKGGEKTVKVETAIRSLHKTVDEHTLSLETVINVKKTASASVKVPEVEASAATELQMKFAAKYDFKTTETSEKEVKLVETTENKFKAPADKDMDVISWTVSKIVFLYRTDQNQRTSLVGASTWDMDKIVRTYDHNVMQEQTSLGGN